jgi:predicted NAD/FAD-dependent oxidoreductase
MIAVIGAGCAGLAAAWKARELNPGEGITVFEKSRGVSGRAATRSVGGCRWDHGANFFKTEGEPEVERLLFERLPTRDLVRISGDVVPFDALGRFTAGDVELNAASKWSYRTGISTLGKLLVAATPGLELRLEFQVTRLEGEPGAWRVVGADGQGRQGPFRRVILTPPAPQASVLVAEACPALAERLARVNYHCQHSFAFAFPGPEADRRPVPGCHALVNADRRHPVAWVSWENDKAGHVPEELGLTVIGVQMQPEWSAARFEVPREDVAAEALREVVRLLGQDGPGPLWWEGQRWKFAHPAVGLGAEALPGEEQGLFVAGDARCGRGRIQLALRDGLEVGERAAR